MIRPDHTQKQSGISAAERAGCSSDSPSSSEMTVEGQKDLILGILISFIEDPDIKPFRDYIRHIGFDISAVSHIPDLAAAWLGHYRLKQGTYDVDRACNDLATWKPIATRISELLREQRGV